MKILHGFGLLALLGLGSCGEIASETGQSCSAGTDCVWPAVCCTAPRIPAFGAPIPLCEDHSYCDAFLPFLEAGNPCNRLPMTSPYELCAEPLVCCPKSLTCATQADCDAAPEPGPAARLVSGATCYADPDCAEGELCMGIYMVSRSGTCQPFGGPPLAEGQGAMP